MQPGPGTPSPTHSRGRDAFELGQLTRVGRLRLANVAPGLVDAQVLGNPQQPVLELVLTVEPAECLERPGEDLLGEVLRVGPAIREVRDERVDAGVVAPDQRRGSFLMPTLCLVDERPVGPGVGLGPQMKDALCYSHLDLHPVGRTAPRHTYRACQAEKIA